MLSGNITSVNLHVTYSLKDGSLECVIMRIAQHVCMRFAPECLDFVKFLCNDGDILSRKFVNYKQNKKMAKLKK